MITITFPPRKMYPAWPLNRDFLYINVTFQSRIPNVSPCQNSMLTPPSLAYLQWSGQPCLRGQERWPLLIVLHIRTSATNRVTIETKKLSTVVKQRQRSRKPAAAIRRSPQRAGLAISMQCALLASYYILCYLYAVHFARLCYHLLFSLCLSVPVCAIHG